MPNSITLIGRIKEAPELRKTPNDISTCTFTVACEQNRNNKATDWYNIVCWRNTAEYAANYGDKGRMIYITGTLQTRTYDTNEGAKRKVYEVIADNIVFVDSKPQNKAASGEIEVTEEDLPF